MIMIYLINNFKYRTLFQHLLQCHYKYHLLFVYNETVCIYITQFFFFNIFRFYIIIQNDDDDDDNNNNNNNSNNSNDNNNNNNTKTHPLIFFLSLVLKVLNRPIYS